MSRFASLLLAGLLASSVANAAAYLEVPDAGDISSPQSTVGTGGLSDIFGTAGGVDLADAFAFLHTNGGGFFFIGQETLSGEIGTLTLYDAAKNVVASKVGNLDLTPADVPVGLYFVELQLAGDQTPYHLFYDGEAQFLVPEPATLSLFGLGFAAVAARRRRR